MSYYGYEISTEGEKYFALVRFQGGKAVNKFAICRVYALENKPHGKQSLGKALRHLDYHLRASDISRPELSYMNYDFMKTKLNYEECIALSREARAKHNTAVDRYNQSRTEEQKERRHLKANASQFFEGVFTYSPEMEDKVPYKEWAQACCKFINDEYVAKGCKIIRAETHRDEKTTHLSFIAMAWDSEKQCASSRNMIGNKKALSQLQDRYIEYVAEFGLVRGISRYKAYESIRKRAISAGYEDTPEAIKTYAEKNNLEIPKRNRHKSLSVWKAEQDALGLELERYNEQLLKTLERLEKIKSELAELIPQEYFDVVQRCESYEQLFKVGESILINDNGKELSLTAYLIEQRQKQIEELGRSLEEYRY